MLWLAFVSGYSEGDIPGMGVRVPFIYHLALCSKVVEKKLSAPRSFRKRVVNLAHEGHQGVVKTKERLRSKVWWQGMDRDAERRCAECYGCQLVTRNVHHRQ